MQTTNGFARISSKMRLLQQSKTSSGVASSDVTKHDIEI